MMGFFLFDWQCGSESMRRSKKKKRYVVKAHSFKCLRFFEREN